MTVTAGRHFHPELSSQTPQRGSTGRLDLGEIDLDAKIFQHIDYRRCWMRYSKRHCAWVPSGGGRDDNAIPAYGAGRPENYRVGTAEWYRAMERDGRLHTEGSAP